MCFYTKRHFDFTIGISYIFTSLFMLDNFIHLTPSDLNLLFRGWLLLSPPLILLLAKDRDRTGTIYTTEGFSYHTNFILYLALKII